MKDKLEDILKKQDLLHDYVEFCTEDDRLTWSESDKQLWMVRQLTAAQAEISEVIEETKFSKWWKNNPDKHAGLNESPDWSAIKEELIDVMFFVFSSMLCAGMTAEEIHSEYVKKWNKNMTRPDWDSAKGDR